ncbi:MAG: 2-hydroxyacyl-CoA dehydratase family protein [Clostridiales Family XIII bacterium]|jgi:benzoyl-CoA reductase/2-hydroxyglutaryl-CoA dehydratase subunit BcrC/BadD/HgdB|nr:2-hydroxyacyl-CoA dehydratase family protein [Clostridiales Family XIII bacterium]
MSGLNEAIRELTEISQNPKESVAKAMRETGKKAVGCFPIYTPDEVVYACGLLPVGMWGGRAKGSLSDRYLQTFCCSIMKANTEQALRGDYDMLSAVIVTAFCDTLKCIIEDWKVAVPHLNILPIVYPQNRKADSGKAYFRAELKRIADALSAQLGTGCTDESLSAAVDLYDEYRRCMQVFVQAVAKKPGILSAFERHHIIKAAYFMDKKDYIPKLRAVTEAIEAAPVPEARKGFRRLVISGILGEPDGLLDLFEECGVAIVGDDLAQESRQFRTIAPREGDGYARMVERIALQDGCAFLYDEKKLRGRMLVDLVQETGAEGVVFNQLKFCDPEEFDWPIVKKDLEAAGIPCLYIETEQQMDSLEQTRTRIQTFTEIL